MTTVEEKMADLNMGQSEKGSNSNPDAAANEAAARQHGWGKPAPYDYGMFTASPAAPRPDVEGATANDDAEAAEARPLFTEDVPAWGANSARYEWKEEYGDVGPAFKLLEDQLFGTTRPERAEYFNE